jgi:hypothetical protein
VLRAGDGNNHKFLKSSHILSYINVMKEGKWKRRVCKEVGRWGKMGSGKKWGWERY